MRYTKKDMTGLDEKVTKGRLEELLQVGKVQKGVGRVGRRVGKVGRRVGKVGKIRA